MSVRVMIEIKNEHIHEAERLLIKDNHFEGEERVPFIKNLNSIDLLAVPGSGKTTALQAKLYCLSKHLPFDNGSGILMLSHTNAAVKEIEKNLKMHSPKLFGYPNFIGTVQSFVNKFLANSGNYFLNGSYLSTIDNDFANKRITDLTSVLPYDNSLSKYLFIQTYNQYAELNKKRLQEEYAVTEVDSKAIIKQLKDIKVIDGGVLVYSKVKNELIDAMPIYSRTKDIVKDIHNKAKRNVRAAKNKRSSLYSIDYCKRQFIYAQSLGFDTDSGKKLKEIFEENFRKGIARYRDCYSFAFWLIENYPIIKSILQKRFKYVFIDEMQDLEDFQIDIIDKIFKSKNSPTVIQRIGDINQAIYNNGRKIKIDADWQPQNQCYYLTGSNRLTQETADIVNYFTLNPQKDVNGNSRFLVKGLKTLNNGINPHLILYDEDTKDILENKFRELINTFSLHETIEGERYGFKIIGWNAKWNDDEDGEHNGKLRLEDIFKQFKKETTEKKEHLNSLSKYLQCFDDDEKSLREVRNNVLNALLSVLKYEKKTYSVTRRGRVVDRYYTQRELMIFMRSDSDRYLYFKAKLYEWTFSLATKRNYSDIYSLIRRFVENEFKNWFDLSINKDTRDFLGERFEKMTINDKVKQETNSLYNEIKIDIGTVHSAKGQTHCATMYVETSYHKYETEKLNVIVGKGKTKKALNNPLYKQEHEYRPGQDSHAKMTTKMMYVGFSRPTHLLCFAVLKKNVINDIDKYISAGWEVVDLT